MTKNKNKTIVSSDEIHAFMEKTLIEAYLKGKGYTLEKLKDLPEADARQLKTEASTYAIPGRGYCDDSEYRRGELPAKRLCGDSDRRCR